MLVGSMYEHHVICAVHVVMVHSGEPQSFTVQVTPNSDYPLDLYILMDLSNSMQDDLEMVRALLDDLSKFLPGSVYYTVSQSLSQRITNQYILLLLTKVHKAFGVYKFSEFALVVL